MEGVSQLKEKQYKLLLLGDQAVGKSSLMNRYIDNVFENNIMGTAGMDLKKKVLNIGNEQVKVYIFETAGQERFRSIAKNQYKNADGIIVIYDVTDINSFKGVNMWMSSIKEQVEGGTECLIIGNKIDLEKMRVISKDEGENMAMMYKVSFIETSAKESVNVENAFIKVINAIYNKDKRTKIVNQNPNKIQKKKSNFCCYSAS